MAIKSNIFLCSTVGNSLTISQENAFRPLVGPSRDKISHFNGCSLTSSLQLDHCIGLPTGESERRITPTLIPYLKNWNMHNLLNTVFVFYVKFTVAQYFRRLFYDSVQSCQIILEKSWKKIKNAAVSPDSRKIDTFEPHFDQYFITGW
jgi:hypothetical protein